MLAEQIRRREWKAVSDVGERMIRRLSMDWVRAHPNDRRTIEEIERDLCTTLFAACVERISPEDARDAMVAAARRLVELSRPVLLVSTASIVMLC